MSFIKTAAASLAAIAMLATPNVAQAGTSDDAEALRKLDIMLMVTSLRCRKGPDNFQSDYQRFSSAHITELNAAARVLQADFVRRAGAQGAKKALDKISVGMANDYGNGHPWLGCGALREVTRNLAITRQPGQLAAAANELLSSKPRGQWAMAGTR